MTKKFLLLASLLLFSGCEKYYISICQDSVDSSYLASSHVKTPDPRQENPPLGDRLIIEWQVPKALLDKTPVLHLHVIYKDYSEQFLTYPMTSRIDYVVYTLLGEEYQQRKGILTYEAKIVDDQAQIFRDWKHQLFTRLIVLSPEDLKEEKESDLDDFTPPYLEENSLEEKEAAGDDLSNDFTPVYHEEVLSKQEEDKASAADSTNSSDLDQPKQESVMETDGFMYSEQKDCEPSSR
jgi:hypothetical protein